MKARLGGGSRSIVPLILNVGTRCRCVANFMPRSLYPGEITPVSTKLKWRWIPERVRAVLKNKKLYIHSDFRTPDLPACSVLIYWLRYWGSVMTSLCGLFMVTVRQSTIEEFPHKSTARLWETLTCLQTFPLMTLVEWSWWIVYHSPTLQNHENKPHLCINCRLFHYFCSNRTILQYLPRPIQEIT